MCSSRLPDGASSTRSGIRYSNIDPDHESSAEPRPTGRQGAPEVEPVLDGHVAPGDGDEARQSRLGGQQIVVARVERPVLRAIADREQIRGRVVEEREVHLLRPARVGRRGRVAARRRRERLARARSDLRRARRRARGSRSQLAREPAPTPAPDRPPDEPPPSPEGAHDVDAASRPARPAPPAATPTRPAVVGTGDEQRARLARAPPRAAGDVTTRSRAAARPAPAAASAGARACRATPSRTRPVRTGAASRSRQACLSVIRWRGQVAAVDRGHVARLERLEVARAVPVVEVPAEALEACRSPPGSPRGARSCRRFRSSRSRWRRPSRAGRGRRWSAKCAARSPAAATSWKLSAGRP